MRDAGEVTDQRGERAELRGTRSAERIAQLRERGQRRARQRAGGFARFEQVGDFTAEAREPICRQRRETAAGNQYQRIARRPRAQCGRAVDAPRALCRPAVATFEPHVEAVRIRSDVRGERRRAKERALRVAVDRSGEAREPLGQRDRFLAAHRHIGADRQFEFALDAARRGAFARFVAYRNDTLHCDETPEHDARGRRIAVHDVGADHQCVAVARGRDTRARRLAARGARQPLRLHVHRDATGEVGQDLAREHGGFVGAKHLSARQLGEFAAVEARLPQRADRVAAQHRVVA